MLTFGPWRFDPNCGDLNRNGLSVRLRPQPAAMLVYLIERRGRVVSREELAHALWPADVHVRFDHGLNSCMKQIRHALGDTPRSSVYVETLPRRGYRFLLEVHHDIVQPPISLPRETIERIATAVSTTVTRLLSDPSLTSRAGRDDVAV